jgi:hypothetical protein
LPHFGKVNFKKKKRRLKLNEEDVDALFFLAQRMTK